MPEVKITGAGAYLTPDGSDRRRPFARGSIANVSAEVAARLIASGVAVPADAHEAGGVYDALKVDALQDLANERGLEVEGTGKDGKVLKADLVAALEADDEQS